jgi:hypothetical protein
VFLLAHGRQPLDGAQRLQLGEGEVVGEPPGHAHAVEGDRAPPVGELGPAGHVGGAADLRLVPRHRTWSFVATRSGSM